MRHPAELAASGMKKRAWFWSALPWLITAAPFVSQLLERFKGGAGQKALKQLQVPGFSERLGHATQRGIEPLFTQTARKLHRYRVD